MVKAKLSAQEEFDSTKKRLTNDVERLQKENAKRIVEAKKSGMKKKDLESLVQDCKEKEEQQQEIFEAKLTKAQEKLDSDGKKGKPAMKKRVNDDKPKKVKLDDEPKRPKCSYMLFADSVREGLIAKHFPDGKKDITVLSGETSKLWNDLSDEKKLPFETKAAELKEQYKKNYAAFLENHPELKKKTKDEDEPKRPKSSYFLFMDSVREEIVDKFFPNGAKKDVKIISGEISKRWGELSEKDKKPFEQQAKVLKEQYAIDYAAFLKKHPERVAPPKKALTAQALYFADAKPSTVEQLKRKGEETDAKNVRKTLLEQWNNLNEKELQAYSKKADQDTERYEEALSSFKNAHPDDWEELLGGKKAKEAAKRPLESKKKKVADISDEESPKKKQKKEETKKPRQSRKKKVIDSDDE
eukprot:GCRY01001250.1.p1 GENE.GCRY01001250.1~~GCRY01001250.1.p1  ORF type:complete len:413 (-),score=111.95 GCRY01001250.1:277-1515(-)